MTHYISTETRDLLADIVCDAFDAGVIEDSEHDDALRGLGLLED